MARIDRYLLQQLLSVFGFFGLVLVLVYWVNRAVVLFDQLIADGQSTAVFFELTVLSLPKIITFYPACCGLCRRHLRDKPPVRR